MWNWEVHESGKGNKYKNREEASPHTDVAMDHPPYT